LADIRGNQDDKLPANREIVLRDDRVQEVESAKQRGVVLGRRLFTEQLTPAGRESRVAQIAGVRTEYEDVDLPALFQERCVSGDPGDR